MHHRASDDVGRGAVRGVLADQDRIAGGARPYLALPSSGSASSHAFVSRSSLWRIVVETDPGWITQTRTPWCLSACEMLILIPEWCTLCESSLNCRTANGFCAAQVRCRVPHCGPALSAGGGGTRAPGRVPAERSGGPDLQRAEGGGAAAKQLPSISALGRMLAKVGLPLGFRFRDLRHTGNKLAASSGASTRDASDGAASMRAALIYQHATSERDQEIAAAIDARIGRDN
jgi:hypothetical protein